MGALRSVLADAFGREPTALPSCEVHIRRDVSAETSPRLRRITDRANRARLLSPLGREALRLVLVGKQPARLASVKGH